jgi:predicted NACHT family NTPase
MHNFQKITKPISILAVILLLLMSTLNQLAAAAMIGTEKLLISERNLETRSYLQQMMSRKQIQEALVARGIDLQEAKIRINSLTDSEIEQIVEKINDLPAGGIDAAFVLIIVGVIAVLFIIVEYTSAVSMFSWFQHGK